MRTGAARGQAGHFHEAGFYASDDEFRALIVPFAEEGIAAGEPVIIGYDDRKRALLRSWLSDPSAVEFIGDESLYATPARAIATYRRLFEFHTAMGAGQIRIAGDVPHPGNGRRFEGWDRYEAPPTAWQAWSRCQAAPRTGTLGSGCGSCTRSTSTLRSATPATASPSGSGTSQAYPDRPSPRGDPDGPLCPPGL